MTEPLDQPDALQRLINHARQRPWRPLGAAICGLATVMFILGVCLLDEKRGQVGFVVYWLTELALVFWLCILAFKDVWYTRRLLSQAKMELLAQMDAESSGPLPADTLDKQEP